MSKRMSALREEEESVHRAHGTEYMRVFEIQKYRAVNCGESRSSFIVGVSGSFELLKTSISEVLVDLVVGTRTSCTKNPINHNSPHLFSNAPIPPPGSPNTADVFPTSCSL